MEELSKHVDVILVSFMVVDALKQNRVLLEWKRSTFKDSSYFYPEWHVAIWDGENWILPYLYPVEVGYGYDTFIKDVSDRVIRWDKLPDWMPSEVVQ